MSIQLEKAKVMPVYHTEPYAGEVNFHALFLLCLLSTFKLTLIDKLLYSHRYALVRLGLNVSLGWQQIRGALFQSNCLSRASLEDRARACFD